MEKKVYNGKYIQVTEEQIGDNLWERVYLKGGIVVYPFNKKGEILLVKEFRPHETPHVRLKPVTGIYEDEYDLEENANREMQEEIGFKADKIEHLMSIKSTGAINNFQEFVVARGLTPSKIPNPDGEDSIQEIVPYSLEKIYNGLIDGTIPIRNSYLGIFKLMALK